MSLSLAAPCPELEKAVEFVSNRGLICIASAGNQGLEVVMYPAGYKQVAGVASTNLADQRRFFSNHGDNSVMVGAPGEELITPYPGGRYAVDGSGAGPLGHGGSSETTWRRGGKCSGSCR